MKIGILGGGQLARMLIESSAKFGFEFTVLSKEKDSPAGLITNSEITGDWTDTDTLMKFVSSCDVITLENEFIPEAILETIEKSGKTLVPSAKCVGLVQDKLIQKKTLTEMGVPTAEFIKVETVEDVLQFMEKHGDTVILKSRTMGYDGKGNFKVSNEQEAKEGVEVLSKRGKLMCEQFINFDKELAVQFARNSSGEIVIYPLVETIQENHICRFVLAEKDAMKEQNEKVGEIVHKIAEGINYTGVMGIEMFLNKDGSLLVNELAPRVHNSGHYTIEGCYTSQFENHIRAVLNLPLGSTKMNIPAAVMVNILGNRNGDARQKRTGEILKKDNVYLHIYGKKETRQGRKMGHITVAGEDLNTVFEIAKECGQTFDI